MKFKANILTIVLLLLTIATYSQIDSLENRKIYSWKLNPYDYSLELETIDTSLTSFQNFNPLLKKAIAPNYLGNLGTAAQTRVYYDRRIFNTGFIFSEPYGLYLNQPKDQKYYNTKSPFTLINYSNGGPKEESEQVLGVLHTQNVNKDWNFGIDYDQISSDGRYENQEVKNNSITVFSSYRNKGYKLHLNMGLEKIKAQENGGIDSLHYLGDDNYDNRRNIPVKLSEAGSRITNTHVYLAQEYNFGKTIEEITVNENIVSNQDPGRLISNKRGNITKNLGNNNNHARNNSDEYSLNSIGNKFSNDTLTTDSIAAAVNRNDSISNNQQLDTLTVFRSSGFSISHELSYSKDKRKFYDDNIDESFYSNKNIFFDSTFTNEEARQRCLDNKLSLNYKYSNKLSIQLSYTDERIKYQYNKKPELISLDTIINSELDTTVNNLITDISSESVYNNKLSVYLKSLLLNKVLFKGYAEYYISGHKEENSKIDLKFAYILWENTEISLEGLYSNKRPGYFYENYTSNNFSWDNDYLRRIEEWDVGVAVRSNKYRLNAKVTYGQISNHLYLDTTAYINQYRDQINLMVGDISKHLNLGPVNSITRFVYQKSTNDSILSLPEYSLYQSLYYERLSKFAATGGKLLWQVGVDYRYFSSYNADGYMPPLGLFYRQFEHKLEDYHRFDLFVNLNIKRARIYLKYSLLNSAINKNYYFSAPFYPEPEPLFKFGLAWTFYD